MSKETENKERVKEYGSVRVNIEEKFRRINDDLEKSLEERTDKLHEQRAEHYRKRRERRKRRSSGGEDLPAAEALVYEARRRRTSRVSRRVSESFIHRTARFIKGLRKAKEEMTGKYWYTQERKKAVYSDLLWDCYEPFCQGIENAVDCGWNFLVTTSHDLWDVLLFLGDMFIKLLYYLWSFVLLLADLLADLAYRIDVHKRALFQGFLFVAAIGIGAVILLNSSTAYEYSYYGEVLGKVRRTEDVTDTIRVLGDKLSEASGAAINLDVERDISFNKVIGMGQKIDTEDDILNNLTYMKDLQVSAYVVGVDGLETVVLDSRNTAETILEKIKTSYVADNTADVEYTSVSYREDIEISEKNVTLKDLWNADDAAEYLKNARVEEGETDHPLLSVSTTELVTYSEPVPFDTVYVDNASLYKGEEEIKSKGKQGETEIIAEVRRVNGEETERTVVSSSVKTEAVSQVVYRGTKPIPARGGTGNFKYPMKTYTISSRFGMRWGRMHTGIDLAAKNGTKIYASDGGVVVYAGSKGTYGNLVIIDHGGLYQTYYAHCSKILVHVGDKIYQGQNIALVGSTGRSTGPHCHFEVRYNGSPQNPLNYIH